MWKSSCLILLVITLVNSLHLESPVTQIANPYLGDIQLFFKDKYNYFVSESNNVVWAGALTLAWNELTQNVIKSDVKVQSSNQIVGKIVDNFNESPFQKSALKQSNYYIKSGFGQKTVDTINKEVKQKFPQKTTPDLNTKLSDQDIISFAYLFKKFQYPLKFQKYSDFKFKNLTTDGFYASSSEQKSQISYLYYNNSNEFLIKVKTKTQKQGVYYLKTSNQQLNVADIIDKTMKWQNQPSNSLESEDRFAMPVINLDYRRDIHQLQNVPLRNQEFQGYQFSKVYQALKLKIDETGIKVQNQGGIIMTLTAMIPFQQPKQFILDDTFWIILKQEGKHPYLCIKINNPVDKQQM